MKVTVDARLFHTIEEKLVEYMKQYKENEMKDQPDEVKTKTRILLAKICLGILNKTKENITILKDPKDIKSMIAEEHEPEDPTLEEICNNAKEDVKEIAERIANIRKSVLTSMEELIQQPFPDFVESREKEKASEHTELTELEKDDILSSIDTQQLGNNLRNIIHKYRDLNTKIKRTKRKLDNTESAIDQQSKKQKVE